MPGLMMLKPVAGLAWQAVRRLLGPPQVGHPQSLTIGQVVMRNETPESQAVPGVPASRRQLVIVEILRLTQNLLEARFALTRAMDGLDARELEQLYDEVSEVIEPHNRHRLLGIVTPRSQD